MTGSELDRMRRTVLEQALLFDDPYSYRCGVEDAIAAMSSVAVRRELPSDDDVAGRSSSGRRRGPGAARIGALRRAPAD